MAKSELLPCPFCGGEARVVKTHKGVFAVGCNNPHCRGDWVISKCAKDESVAIAAWNTRAETRAERDLRDELNWMHAEEHGTRMRLWRALNTITDCTRELLDHAGVPYIVMPVSIEEALCEATCHVTGKRYDILRGWRVVFGRWEGE